MKKIFLYAYDYINLGDDLFIETIANRYPDTEIYFWTNVQNQKVFEKQKNLKIIDENSTKTKMLKKSAHLWQRDTKQESRKSVMPKYILEVPSLWNIQHGKILYHGGNIKAVSIHFLC